MYLFLIFKGFFWLKDYDWLFGENSIVFSKQFSNLGLANELAYFLQNQNTSHASLYFIVALLLLCGLNFTKYSLYFLFDFAIWFLVLNLHNKIYSTLSGGEYILNQLLFFNCFLSKSFQKKDGALLQVKIMAHNFGLAALLLQVCLVYFFSAIIKLNDSSWINGNAVALSLEARHYSLPLIYGNGSKLNWFFVLLNYSPLVYQLIFPVAVWFKKIKKPFLLIGIVMHLFIALVMGLLTFGTVMLLCYILFWPEKSKD